VDTFSQTLFQPQVSDRANSFQVNFLGGAVGGAPAFGGGGDLNHLFQHIQAVAAAAAAAAASSAAAAEGDGGHTEAIARHRAGGGRGGDPRQTVSATRL
jgi:hypothetical protein